MGFGSVGVAVAAAVAVAFVVVVVVAAAAVAGVCVYRSRPQWCGLVVGGESGPKP